MKIKISNIRHYSILVIFGIIILSLVTRLIYLQIINKDFLRAQGASRSISIIDVPAYRGMIKDRNGTPLAVSAPVESVWINPQQFIVNKKNIITLATTLKLPPNHITTKIKKYLHKEFVYIKRHTNPDIAGKIKALGLNGVYLTTEYRRYYPTGEVMAPLLGFTNIDDIGQEGLELALNSWLSGVNGKNKIIRDRLGRKVEQVEKLQINQAGKDVTLSLDSKLQYLAYRAIQDAVVQHVADSGSAVVLDVDSGEVLAMANFPSFNPNMREKSNNYCYRNRAITDYIEPGSVMKAFSIASILENMDISTDALINTNPGFMKLPGGVVRDLKNNGIIEVKDILKHSSNVAISKLILKLKDQALWRTYDRLGFGWSTNSGFPGESHGVLPLVREQQSFVLSTMAFGYGLTATPLQLARAYAILGANGVKKPVTFIKLDNNKIPSGVPVLRKEVTKQVIDMLSRVVEHKASRAKVAGYKVVGKSGTTRLLGESGYDKGKHRAVFAGLVPADGPKFAIVVVVHHPKSGAFYGNQVAAPVFVKIAEGALRLFDVS